MNRHRGLAQNMVALSLGGVLGFFALAGTSAAEGGTADDLAAATFTADPGEKAALRVTLAGLDDNRPALRLGLNVGDANRHSLH